MNRSAFPVTQKPSPTSSRAPSLATSPTQKFTRVATPVTRAEAGLLVTLLLALLVACVGPHVAQHAHYHAFADQRTLWGVPCALDVLSNLAFALMGVWGLAGLRGHAAGTTRNLAGVFFCGLVVTAVCSALYHLQPGDAALAVDRLGMVLAFAGLTGLAVTERLSERAGVAVAATVLVAGPLAVLVWQHSANLLPWSVLQGGGMLLVLAMALRRPLAGAWGLPLGAVIAWYTVAKLLELGDYPVFMFSQGLVSGHSLKHVCAAMAAWPVIALMHNGAHARPGQHRVVGA